MKNNLQKYLVQIIRDKFVQAFFNKVILRLGWSASGFQGWLAKFLVENAFEYIAKPIVQFVITKGILVYDIADGHFKIKKIKKSKDEGDDKTYWDTISDI